MSSLVLALLLAGGTPNAAPPTAAVPTFRPLESRSLESYEELTKEFDAAVAEWRKAVKEADREQRSELRDNPPAKQFYPRYEALAAAGQGRALLWMADNIRDIGLDKSERETRTNEIFEKLVAGYANELWFDDALTLIDRRNKGDDFALGLYERVIESSSSKASVAYASYLLGKALLNSSEPERIARGEKLLEQAIANGAGASWVSGARKTFNTIRLKPGHLAPDFEAQTIDGHEFKLSDYRGKVVMLDFYGFW